MNQKPPKPTKYDPSIEYLEEQAEFERKRLIEIGRSSLKNGAVDLKNMHNISIAIDVFSDEECLEIGKQIIDGIQKAAKQSIIDEENDRNYLMSLSAEERQYVLLKRKYEPSSDWC